jgi:hypothetical protein
MTVEEFHTSWPVFSLWGTKLFRGAGGGWGQELEGRGKGLYLATENWHRKELWRLAVCLEGLSWGQRPNNEIAPGGRYLFLYVCMFVCMFVSLNIDSGHICWINESIFVELQTILFLSTSWNTSNIMSRFEPPFLVVFYFVWLHFLFHSWYFLFQLKKRKFMQEWKIKSKFIMTVQWMTQKSHKGP